MGEPAATADFTALDGLCVNTIRTLAMDAVQKANSGHPGAPMGLAPVAYALWQKYLRYDPKDPLWPNRDRFVLSNGHASMLLYSLIPPRRHPRHDRPRLEGGGRAVPAARPAQELPAASQPHPRAPGEPHHRRGRDDHRAARPGGRELGRHGDRPEVDRGHVRQAGVREPVRAPGVLHPGRRVHDGGRHVRGRVPGRAPEARQPVLDLRRQPHLDRREHEHHVHRGRGRPVPGLRVGRAAGDGRERRSPVRRVRRDVPEDGRQADPHHREDAHRVRVAEQAGQEGSPRQPARRGRGQRRPRSSSAGRRTSRSTSRTGCTTGSRKRWASGGPTCGRRGTRRSPTTRRSTRTSPSSSSRCRRASCPTGGTAASRRSRPTRRGWRPGPVRGRCSTPSPSGCRGSSAGRPTSWNRPRRKFTGAGRSRPRTGPGGTSTSGVREHGMTAIGNGLALCKLRPFVSSFLTFTDYARGAIPAVGPGRAAGPAHLHPRLDRPRGRRPDPPADRTPGQPAGHAQPHHPPPGRRERGGRGVQGGDAGEAPPGHDGAVPAERDDVRPVEVRFGGRRRRRAGTCWRPPTNPTSS